MYPDTDPDTNIDSYLSSRASLISEERSLRKDFQNLHAVTEDEHRADQIIRAIRLQEASTIWSIESSETRNVFPGMEFLSARELITTTKLFKILSKMPKGALLHSHLDAMVNTSVLLNMALKQPAMHVRVPKQLTEDSIKTDLPDFCGLPESEFAAESAPSLTSSSYAPGSWVQISRARDTFSPALGGPSGFDKWVVDSLMINPKEAYGTHNTVTKIWEKFRCTFAVSGGLIRYFPIWIEYVREFFLSSIEDGISFVETRFNFFTKGLIHENGKDIVPNRECLIVFDRIIKEVKAELTRQGRPDAFLGARIIYATLRFVTCEELEWYMEDCIQLKKEFPHLIAGFDLVGPENDWKPLIDYIEPLLRFKKRVEDLGLEIPFIFHAGETFGDGTEADNNLYDAILLGTRRIGHGFSLAKHPKLMEMCKERSIAVEVCPISNEVLRLTSSMCAHPLPVLLNNGVSVALCSDDPAVFGNMGLTFDFFQVLVASDINGLSTMGNLARQSLEFCTLGEDDKSAALKIWGKRWEEFVKEIIQEYGTPN